MNVAIPHATPEIAEAFKAIDEAKVLGAVLDLRDALPEGAQLHLTVARRGLHDEIGLGLEPPSNGLRSARGEYDLAYDHETGGVYLRPRHIEVMVGVSWY